MTILDSKESNDAMKRTAAAQKAARQAALDKAVAVQDQKAAYAERAAAQEQKVANDIRANTPKT